MATHNSRLGGHAKVQALCAARQRRSPSSTGRRPIRCVYFMITKLVICIYSSWFIHCTTMHCSDLRHDSMISRIRRWPFSGMRAFKYFVVEISLHIQCYFFAEANPLLSTCVRVQRSEAAGTRELWLGAQLQLLFNQYRRPLLPPSPSRSFDHHTAR